MRKIYSVFFLTLLLLTGLSCDDQSHGEDLFENSDRIICAEVSYLFSDNQTEVDSEDNIEEIGAYLFDEGKFVKEYIGSKQAHSKYEFRLDAMKGNLYVVANASLLPDFASPAPGLSEEEWRKTIIHSTDGKAERVYTGVVSLSNPSDYVIPVSLKRAAARFDLRIAVAGTVEVKEITFKNVAKNAYLFPQSEVVSPEVRDTTDISLVPEQPYHDTEPGILYVYEQHNRDLKVVLNATIEGKEYSLESDLPETISRNTVYSITLRKDVVDKEVQLTVEE